MILPIIIAGGSGTRLWPLSRQLHPKQFLPFMGDKSLLQDTLRRLAGEDYNEPWLICNEAHRFLAAEQLREMQIKGQIFLEPEGRNTAPAIAIAALQAIHQYEDALLLVLPADHVIQDVAAFQKTLQEAKPLAEKGMLVTFGVTPLHAETGYGYIHKGEALADNSFKIKDFVEKPDAKKALLYVNSGEYLWNSGMFMFRASQYIEELKKFEPLMVSSCEQALSRAVRDHDFIRLHAETFKACPSDSIDYALMEKTSHAAVIELDAGWSDLGSWSALWELHSHDAEGNAVKGDVVLDKVNNSLIHAEHRLVAAIGVDNVVIVETKDAVLVVAKDQVQRVKSIVDKIKQDDRHEHLLHREVYRPWGRFDSIDSGYRYQVKRITVKPGASLSMQMHYHRAEHWVVVSGTARVTCGDRTFLITENQSTYIPVGEIHALENPGKVPLELIEVQSGDYLGEDDIVRFKDVYGRVSEKATV